MTAVSAERWSEFGNTPAGVGIGGALVSYDGALYVMQGNGTMFIWKYASTWSELSLPNDWLGAGLDMEIRPDGSLYLLYSKDDSSTGAHARSYDLNSYTWSEPDLYFSANIQNGIDLAFDENYLYALQTEKTSDGHGPFWRYSLSSGWWETPQSAMALPGGQVGPGACLESAMASGDYAASGVLTSEAVDAGNVTVKYDSLSWSSTTLSGTEIRFEIRAADTLDGLESSSWIAVEGSSAPISDLSGRYVQWRATLIADAPYPPVLHEVTLSYSWSMRSWVQTAEADFSSGSMSNIDTAADPGSVMLTAGTMDRYIYAFQGGGSSAFYRYNADSNTWANVTSAPGNVTEGACLVSDQSRYIYALQGGSDALWRYDTWGDSWDSLGPMFGTAGSGADLAYDNGTLYVLQGGGGTGLWKYDIGTGSWTMVGITPSEVGKGGAMVFYQGTLYVMRGNGTLTVWAYSGGIWSELNIPGSWLSAGLDMVLGPDGSLYALYMQNNNLDGVHTFSYDLNSYTWSQMRDLYLGTNIQNGIDLAFDGDYIYALQTEKTNGGHGPFWRCDLNSGWWNTPGSAKALPGGQVGPGACLVSVALGSQYASRGNLTSPIFDTTVAGMAYESLSWEVTLPPGTSIQFWARASDTIGSISDAEWTPVTGSGSSLDPLSGRYVQWKAALSTADPDRTPILHEVKLRYGS